MNKKKNEEHKASPNAAINIFGFTSNKKFYFALENIPCTKK